MLFGVLILLDIARSIYARVGYEQPNAIWQPDPAQYAELNWPPGADLPANAPIGQRVYAQHCAVCHGPDGRGNGPAAPSLRPHPRDFTKGQFKYKSTPVGQPPTDEDLIRVVSEGLQASAMPYWRDLLTEQEIREVISYIKSMSPVFQKTTPRPLAIPPRVPADEASVGRGKALFAGRGCSVCHGPNGRGMIPMIDMNGYTVISRDLSAPWTFRGRSTPEQIWLRITTGLAPSPMPAFETVLIPTERWDLVNYVLSLRRPAPGEPGGTLDGPGQQPDLLRRGEYLVRASMCGICHTEINPTGIYRGDTHYLAGGADC